MATLSQFIRPSPPFLEIGLYHRRSNDGANLAGTLNDLLSIGAIPNGMIGVWDKPASAFAGIYDREMHEELVAPACLEAMLRVSPPTIAQIYLLIDGHNAILTFLSITDLAAQFDHHPIALWLGGEDLDMSVAGPHNKLGQLACNLLFRLTDDEDVAYSALTVDYGLECPYDLAHRSDSGAFSDFLLPFRSFTPNQIEDIAKLFVGAHIERHSLGVYISCTPAFNNSGTASRDWLGPSHITGKLVAKAILA